MSLKALEKTISIDCEDEPLVFVYRTENDKTYRVDAKTGDAVLTRQYTLKEFINVRRRPFSSRLYISGTNIDYQTVWLRTRFTDNARYIAPTRKVRDYVKAALTSHNEAAAKSAIADLLTLWFQMDNKSEYYSMACMLGSALSSDNTLFESRKKQFHNSYIIESQADQIIARHDFHQLMHILFDKLSLERLLVGDEQSNIYRLAHCLRRQNPYAIGVAASFVSFAIQITLTAYVIFENFGNFTPNLEMIPLTILTTILSILMIVPSVKTFPDVINFYYCNDNKRWWQWNSIAIMDIVSNFVLPYILIVSGAVVILIQEAYIDAVLNSAALLFIIEIDDLLPVVLDLDYGHIVRNYLIEQSVRDFNVLFQRMQNPMSSRSAVWKKSTTTTTDIEFSDMDLTNSIQQGTDVTNSSIFAPYEIEGTNGTIEISPSNYVSRDCLISKLEFSYTQGYPLATSPRVGYLRVTMLKDGSVFNYTEKGTRNVDYDNIDERRRIYITNPHEETEEAYEMELQDLVKKHSADNNTTNRLLRKDLDAITPVYVLEGVYMITAFELSESIFKLRVAGSKTAGMFEAAMDYYSLWDLDAGAARVLERAKKSEGAKKKAEPPVAAATNRFHERRSLLLKPADVAMYYGSY